MEKILIQGNAVKQEIGSFPLQLNLGRTMPLRMPVRHGREYYSYRHQSGWRSLWSLQAHSAKIFDSCRSGYFPTENLCKSRHSISHLFIVYALKHTAKRSFQG